MNSLVHYFKKLEDYRHPKGKRHQLLPNLIIMRMAMTCGDTGLRAIARLAQIYRELLKEHLPLPRSQVPSCPTRQRLRKGTNCTLVIHGFNKWMSQALTAERIAIDGKSITGTVNSSHEAEPNFVSLVSFFRQPRTLISTEAEIFSYFLSPLSLWERGRG